MFKATRRCYEEMIEDAKKRFPNEACGLLAGKDLAVTFYSMRNTDQSPVTYFMDPKEQFQIFKEIRSRGGKMLGIYHSHVATEAYPSAKDVAFAFYSEVHYVIVSLENREKPVARAFRIENGEVREEEVVLVAAPST